MGLDDYMSCVLGAQPMLGAIITTRSLSVKAANPTLKMNKSGKNAYFHFLPLPAPFFHFNLRGGKSVQKSPSFVVFGQNHNCIVGGGIPNQLLGTWGGCN